MAYTEEEVQATINGLITEHHGVINPIRAERNTLRKHNEELKKAIRLLLDASWNGPISADHSARIYAAKILATD